MSRTELHRLRYFVAVAEELNFGRAARRLHIAQPPLSQQIAKLEAEIGAKLLRRSKRCVELTLAGQMFLIEARATLEKAAHAVEVARRAARGEVGELSIGYTASADLNVLPVLLPKFRRLYPHVQLKFTSMFQSEQLKGLQSATIDVGFLRLPVGAIENVAVLPLLSEAVVAVLPQSHPLASRASVSLSEIEDRRVIVFPRRFAPGLFDQIAQAITEARSSAELLELSDHIQFSLSLISMGEGISILPESLRVLERRGVVYVALHPTPFRSEIGMIWRADDQTEMITNLVDAARDAFELSRGDMVQS